MTRRPGLSLTEVLVALFIMGIGTIAVLTLFPLGALNMAQAFRDDRTSQGSGQAEGFLQWYVRDRKSSNTLASESWMTALDDPGYTSASKYLIRLVDPADPLKNRPYSGPSYAVVIDPMGHIARGGAGNRASWVGDNGFGNGNRASYADTSALSRHTLALVNDTTKVTAGTQRQFAQRICTLLDGMGYDRGTGAPDTSSGTIDRDIRYNWLWVVQRGDNKQTRATMTVVVFDRRAPMYAPPGSETVYQPTFAQPDQTRVTFPIAQAPPLQRGGWLMDATVVTADDQGRTFFVPSSTDGAGPLPPGATLQPWIRNANFYRVASVTEDAVNGTLEVELETPLKRDVEPPLKSPDTRITPLPADFRRFVYLNGAAEVFVRPIELDL